MPRNSQGLYTLPLPPVNPGELIESPWANTTLDDIASAITGSLPRDGSAPMTGPLILSANAPTNDREAISKGYVDRFILYATGMPVGAILPYAGDGLPGGWVLCDGRAIVRADFPDLFAVIGTIYGVGDGTTTFNVPDLRDSFLKGRNGVPVGTKQDPNTGSHTHVINDPGHAHGINHTHTLTTAAHSHTASQSSHNHHIESGFNLVDVAPYVSGSKISNAMRYDATVSNVGPNTALVDNTVTPAVNVALAQGLTGTTGSPSPNVSASAMTGIIVGTSGAGDTVPRNVAVDFYIKAFNDSSSTPTGAVETVTSADVNVLLVDATDPLNPVLVPQTNIPFGMAKLDSAGQLPLAQLPPTAVTSIASGNDSTITINNADPHAPVVTARVNTANGLAQLDVTGLIPPSLLPYTAVSNLGFFDCSGGQNPSEAYPATNYNSGDQYLVSVGGTILVYDPVTLLASMTLMAPADTLLYLENTANPNGWYGLSSAFSGDGPPPSNDPPLMDGIASPGDDSTFSRGDHVHPSDTSRALVVHTHTISQVDTLQTTLDGKAALVHTHTISQVDNLQTALDGKANVVHTHVISDVINLQTSLDGKAVLTTNSFSGVQTFGAATREKASTMGANAIDCTLGSVFSKTISGATTLTVSGAAPSGSVSSFLLNLTNGGSATITWWSGVKWAGGIAPTLTAAGRDVLGFFTIDGGATWSGFVLGKDLK